MKRLYGSIAAAIVCLSPAAGQAGIVDLRGLVSSEAGLLHHYTFEGATNTARLADSSPGGAHLTVVSYGTGLPVVGVANGIRLDQPGWDGTGTTLTPFNDGLGFQSGGAGTSTVADIALPAAMTVEAIIRPLASPNGVGYAVSTRASTNQRGYYLRQSDLVNSITTAVGDTDTSRARAAGPSNTSSTTCA